jgi:hypothetical protein
LEGLLSFGFPEGAAENKSEEPVVEDGRLDDEDIEIEDAKIFELERVDDRVDVDPPEDMKDEG